MCGRSLRHQGTAHSFCGVYVRVEIMTTIYISAGCSLLLYGAAADRMVGYRKRGRQHCKLNGTLFIARRIIALLGFYLEQ